MQQGDSHSQQNNNDYISRKKQTYITRLLDSFTCLAMSVYSNNMFGRKTYLTAMIIEHFALGIILLITSHPSKEFEDYINFKDTSITQALNQINFALVFGLILFVSMFTHMILSLRILLNTKDFDDAKEHSIIKQLISIYVGVTRTLLAFPISLSMSISAQNLLDPANNGTIAYYVILFTLIPNFILYSMSLVLAFKITQLPIQTTKFFWNCIYVKNIYIREIMKILLMLADSFIPTLRGNKTALIVFFLVICVIYCYLNYSRTFFYNHLVDRVQMYCLRGVLSISYACLIRVIFEIQLLELIIFYPIILYVTIKLFEFFEQRWRRKIFDMIEHIETLPQNYIQQIILQILQMTERQSLYDLRELQNIYYRHRLSCYVPDCVCNRYYQTIIENFKDDVKLQEQLAGLKTSSEGYANSFVKVTAKDKMKETELYASDLTLNQLSMSNQVRKSQADDQIDANMIDIEMVSQTLNFQNDNVSHKSVKLKSHRNLINMKKSSMNKSNEMYNTDIQVLIKEEQKMSKLQLIDEGMNSEAKFDNFTFAFSDNHQAVGISYDDFFKEVSALEVVNKKIYDANNSQQQSNRTILEIQQLKFESEKHARKYFYIWLLEQIFKQYEGNQNQNASSRNIEFELLYINFINQNLQKHFLAIFQLLRIHDAKLNLSFFDRLLFSFSEQIMLEEAINNFKNYFGGFNYNLFIEGNYSSIELDNNYEKTTTQIIEFWQKFKGNDIKLQSMIDLGVKISKRINQIKRGTKRQEETYAIRKDLGKYQLYAMFHLNMLYDPSTFNQMSQYLKNSLVFKARKVLGHDQGISEDSKAQVQQEMMDEKGICIVEGWNNKGQKGNLRFLFANKTFCDIFKTTQLQLTGQQISQIMPDEIRYAHGDLVHRFYSENKRTILGNMRIQFAKTFDGFILPVKMRINFYYHPQFKYSFFAQFEKIQQMNIFNEEQTKIQTDDCMFLVTDEKLGILDYSENLLSILGITKHRISMFEENTGHNLRLNDIVVDLQEILLNEFGEAVLPETKDLSLVNKIVKCRKYKTDDGQFSNLDVFSCILSYTQQSLQTQFYTSRLNVFMIIPLTRHPDYEGIMSNTQMGTRMGIGSTQIVKKSVIAQSEERNSEEQNDEIQQMIESLGSADSINNIKGLLSRSSASSNTSSQSSGITSAFYAKNLLFQNTAPKVIKVNLVLIITMIVAFFVINIYNLAIFLNKHSYIKGRFDTYSYISQRNARLRASLLDLKMIHQLTQNSTIFDNKNLSDVFPSDVSRLKFYQEDLQYNLNQVRLNADMFNQFIMSNQDFYSFDLQFDDLAFISEKGNTYTQDVSYKHSINLFISYANDVSINDFLSQKPKLNVETYEKNQTQQGTSGQQQQSIDKQLTKLEQNLYFLFENGLYKMSQLGQRQSFMLTIVSTQQTEDGMLILNVSTFVSIGIVTLIGIIIFPLVSKVIDRQYAVIMFFNFLDVEAIDKIIEQGYKFQSQLHQKIGKSIEGNYNPKIDQDGESPYNSDDDIQQDQAKWKENNRKSLKEKFTHYNKSDVDSQQYQNDKQILKQQSKVNLEKQNKEYNDEKYLQQQRISKFKEDIYDDKKSKMRNYEKERQKNLKLNKDIFEEDDYASPNEKKHHNIAAKKQKEVAQHNNNSVKNSKNKQSKLVIDSLGNKTFVMSSSSDNDDDEEKRRQARRLRKQQRKKDNQLKEGDNNTKQHHKSKHHQKDQQKTGILVPEVGGNVESDEDVNKNKQIAAQIKALSIQKRFKICILIGLLMMYLNASLLISFYQSQIVFSNDKDSSARMSKFYQREECAYNLLLFMRERIIRNQSIMIDIYNDQDNTIHTAAVSYYIDKCYQNEFDIQQMRKTMPDYLIESADDFDGMESNQLCDLTFTGYIKDPRKAISCKTALESLLMKGLGNTMYYIIGYIQQMNFNLDSPLAQSQVYLNQLLNQKKYHELSDFILYYLADSFDFLQQIVIDAGEIYFTKAKQNFLLAFGLFMSATIILTIVIGFFAYKKAKESVLDIQNMLILIPLDQIQPQQRQKIERYLNK